jgi:hypothetical protein
MPRCKRGWPRGSLGLGTQSLGLGQGFGLSRNSGQAKSPPRPEEGHGLAWPTEGLAWLGLGLEPEPSTSLAVAYLAREAPASEEPPPGGLGHVVRENFYLFPQFLCPG